MTTKKINAIQVRAMRDWLRWMGQSSPGAQVHEARGVTAAIVPAVPGRSIPNSVAYESVDALDAALQKITAAYDKAGVRAWSVWTPEHDREAIALLGDAGHSFDGAPAAMTLDLTSFEAPAGVVEIDWDDRGDPGELAVLNDEAYGYQPGEGIAAAIGMPRLPIDELRFWRARVGGETASALATIDHDDDLGVYFVATPQRHRGKGLATALLATALIEARERGLRTSSLQSSELGRPVYERLGYEAHYALHLYERRAD